MHACRTGANHVLHQFKGIQIAAKTSFGVGHDRREPVDAVVPIERVNLVCSQERVIDSLDHFGHGVHRVKTLVRIHLAGAVAIAGNLPAGTVDGFEARLDFLDRLVAGQRTERAQRLGLVDQSPQFLGTDAGQRMLDRHGAAQLDHVRGAVVALHAFPPWAFRPFGLQSFDLIIPLHDSLPRNIDQGPESGNLAGRIAINHI